MLIDSSSKMSLWATSILCISLCFSRILLIQMSSMSFSLPLSPGSLSFILAGSTPMLSLHSFKSYTFVGRMLSFKVEGLA